MPAAWLICTYATHQQYKSVICDTIRADVQTAFTIHSWGDFIFLTLLLPCVSACSVAHVWHTCHVRRVYATLFCLSAMSDGHFAFYPSTAQNMCRLNYTLETEALKV